MRAKPTPPVTFVVNEDHSDEENAPQVRHLNFMCKLFKGFEIPSMEQLI